MPNFDGTGPRGEGPKTGLGLGKCQGQPDKEQGDSLPQRGMGAGRQNRPRAGRGRRGGGGAQNRQTSDES